MQSQVQSNPMLEDLRQKRSGTFTRSCNSSMLNKGSSYNQMASAKGFNQPMYFSQHSSSMPAAVFDTTNGLGSLAEGFGRINFSGSQFPPNATSTAQYRFQPSEYGGVPLTNNLPFLYNNPLVLAPQQMPPGTGGLNQNGMTQPSFYPNAGTAYLNNPNGYANYAQHLFNSNGTPMSNWGSSRQASHDMPSLITPRRDSNSSGENDTPGTPYTQYTGYEAYNNGIAIMDRSPHGSLAAWSTPSPSQPGYGMVNKRFAPTQVVSARLQGLIAQDPSIPPAIPAPYSPGKPLDRSLENPTGTTNVYIRGLLPDTTDEKLHALAVRFGDIISSKSIIDLSTGFCKGFGFVKYHNFKDAEDCIRGFHAQGYETSFARESFYSQLKKLGDEANTNLYVSNLPKDMNEHELGSLFGPHKVCSARILRDRAGNGRGVGFARFETRDVCEDVIRDYNNTPVSKVAGEEYTMQIRYADTQDQKALKQQTTAAREYRTAEYESQTRGTLFVPEVLNNEINTSAQTSGGDDDFEKYLQSCKGSKSNTGFGPNGSNLSGKTNPHGIMVPSTVSPGPQSGSSQPDNSALSNAINYTNGVNNTAGASFVGGPNTGNGNVQFGEAVGSGTTTYVTGNGPTSGDGFNKQSAFRTEGIQNRHGELAHQLDTQSHQDLAEFPAGGANKENHVIQVETSKPFAAQHTGQDNDQHMKEAQIIVGIDTPNTNE